MQHHSCDFAPVSTFRVRVEQAQLRDDVLLVVNGQYEIGGRGIGDIGIKRRLLHGRSRNRLLIDPLCFGLLGILMTRTSGVHFTPMNGHRQFEPSGPKSANNRHQIGLGILQRGPPGPMFGSGGMLLVLVPMQCLSNCYFDSRIVFVFPV
jgi:hypothetical protein